MGPYMVLRRIDMNVYVLVLLEGIHTNPIFNVVDLMPYLAPLPIDSKSNCLKTI